ncbi:hypothetical protein [Allomuricauda sp. F6463D]|uniref:hypothetical protein n=1 Tax=Allomuricauda sp. F6463D TaxID=2926409 RepID=UPI001FF32352|nr:hypothetical protein [Muricauda sp. F6463D]MCK0159434.1 hypothetical protein [Muricauda sp. F6463D]
MINFNFEVNNYLKNKFNKEKWSGASPKFYKNDVPNLIKCIKIEKAYKHASFSCFLSVYSNFSSSIAPKRNIMDTNNQVFLVGLTPNEVTDKSYHWQLTDDKDFNNQQFNILWESIAGNGNIFFNRFNNFPEPFLNIKPEDFNKGEVKLFNTYEVFNQVNYMNFLKEIHLSLNQIEIATSFSTLAIERFHKNLKGKSIAHNKAYKSQFKKYLKSLEMP